MHVEDVSISEGITKNSDSLIYFKPDSKDKDGTSIGWFSNRAIVDDEKARVKKTKTLSWGLESNGLTTFLPINMRKVRKRICH